MGIAVPSEAERRAMVAQLEHSAGVPEMSAELVDMRRDSSSGRLLQVSAHHFVTMLNPFDGRLLHPRVLQDTGAPELSRSIAEGIDPRVREHSVDGSWQSLNVSMVCMAS